MRDLENRKTAAFTLIELLIVIAIVGVLVVLFLPAPSGSIHRARDISCMNNLKQLALGLMIFMDDHAGEYPWKVASANGGSLEVVGQARTYPHWLTLSNYLRNPNAFVCPTDTLKQVATNYSGFGESNVSYFVNLDAVTNSAGSVLAGDRHLRIDEQKIAPGLFRVPTNGVFGWTRELHSRDREPCGNVAYADGHGELQKGTFPIKGHEANRLVIP